MILYVRVGYPMYIRICNEEGQQQQPFDLNDADGVPGRLGLFKVVSIFVTFINDAKMSIHKVFANTLKLVYLLATIGYFGLFYTHRNLN